MRFRFGSFELDEDRLLLLRDGRALRVRPMVFDLLATLLRHRHRVVLRDELIGVLWGRTAVGPGSLSGLVNELRGLLGESGRGASSIRTVHARGYQFVARVEELCDDAASPPSATSPAAVARPLASVRRRLARTFEGEGLPVLPDVLADALLAHVSAGEVDLDAVTRWLRRAREASAGERVSAPDARPVSPSETGSEAASGRVGPGDRPMRRVEPDDTKLRRTRAGTG